jgi:hypothetical protein
MTAAKKKSGGSSSAKPVFSLPVKVGAGVVGLVVLSWLFFFRPSDAVRTLAGQIAALRAQCTSPTGELEYENYQNHLREFRAIAAQPSFAHTSKVDRDFVETAIRDFEGYQNYAQALAAVSDPKSAANVDQLEKISTALESIPQTHHTRWRDTELEKTYSTWTHDAEAMRLAVNQTERAYADLIRDGKQIIETADQPNLPVRISGLFERAKAVPDPQRDKEKLIPRSQRITYDTVFGLPPLPALYRQWKAIEVRLKPLSTSSGP